MNKKINVCSLSKNLNVPKHSKLFWKSNAHTHTLNWCAFSLDGVKHWTDHRTNERTAFLGVGYVISFACQSETIHAESSNFETHVTAFTSSYPPLAFSLFLIGNMKMGPTLIIQSCDGEHNPYFIGMMDLFVDWRTSLQMSPGSLSASGSPCNTRIISVSTTAASACLLTRARPKLRNVKTNLHLNLKSWNQKNFPHRYICHICDISQPAPAQPRRQNLSEQ